MKRGREREREREGRESGGDAAAWALKQQVLKLPGHPCMHLAQQQQQHTPAALALCFTRCDWHAPHFSGNTCSCTGWKSARPLTSGFQRFQTGLATKLSVVRPSIMFKSTSQMLTHRPGDALNFIPLKGAVLTTWPLGPVGQLQKN